MKLPSNISLWLRCLALYLSLGAVVVLVSHFVFSYSGFLHTDVDSARYMLSALVQGEAAIVALVVTLSLVAVHLWYILFDGNRSLDDDIGCGQEA